MDLENFKLFSSAGIFLNFSACSAALFFQMFFRKLIEVELTKLKKSSKNCVLSGTNPKLDGNLTIYFSAYETKVKSVLQGFFGNFCKLGEET